MQIVGKDTPKMLKVFEEDFITEATIQLGLEHVNIVPCGLIPPFLHLSRALSEWPCAHMYVRGSTATFVPCRRRRVYVTYAAVAST